VLVIQISTYPNRAREQKEAFTKAITNTEILNTTTVCGYNI